MLHPILQLCFVFFLLASSLVTAPKPTTRVGDQEVPVIDLTHDDQSSSSDEDLQPTERPAPIDRLRPTPSDRQLEEPHPGGADR